MAEQLTPQQIRTAEKNAAGEGYVHRDLVAIDQAANVASGGMPDETISSRVRRVSDAHRGWGWNPGIWLAKALNAGLNLIQKDHGARAEAGDLERAAKAAQVEREALGVGCENSSKR